MKHNLVIPTLKCLRCGHRWIPRQPEITMCARCKSLLWNSPKKKATS